MMMTEYLIDVLCRLSCLVSCAAMLTAAVALWSALLESVTSKPSKGKLGFCVFVAFFCMVISIIMPDQETIRYFAAG